MGVPVLALVLFFLGLAVALFALDWRWKRRPWPGGPPPPYASQEWLADLLSGLLVLMVVVHAGGAFQNTRWEAYYRAALGGDEQPDLLASLEHWDWRLVVAFLLIGLSTTVTFVVWSVRCCRNLPALGHTEPRYSPARVGLSWFLPFVCLWRPYLAISEGVHFCERADGRYRFLLLRSWWGLRLMALFIGVQVAVLQEYAAAHAEEPLQLDALAAVSRVATFQHLLEIPAALLALAVVRRATRLQEAAFDRLSSSP